MTSCSIVIPVYNRAPLTDRCLTALDKSLPPNAEIEVVVVDDASSDSTRSVLADHRDFVRVIRRDANGGFAAACNTGFAASSGEWLVFFNNDLVPEPGWLEALFECAARRTQAGVIGSKLLFPNGTIQHAGVVISRELTPRHVYAGFPADHPAVNKSREFQIVTGACALVRREVFADAGGFDTAFANGYEDVDLCLRLRRLGLEVHYCHMSVLHHLETATRGLLEDQDLQNFNLFSERWADEIYQDDLNYYQEDGLLEIVYREHYPAILSVSPDLAVLADGRASETERALATRSQQVYDARKENRDLHIELLEANYRVKRAQAE